MAEAAIAPSTTPATPPAGMDAILSSMGNRGQELAPKADALVSQLGEISKSRADTMERLDTEADSLKPPTLETPPPPVARSTDPKQIWGSSAMMLAGIGSLFTRTPLTTAMNAAAKVMESYKAGDRAAADQAFKTWEVANKNAIDLANFQQNAYETALRSVERRQDMTARESEAATQTAIAAFTAQASAFRDQTALEIARMQGIEGVEQLLAQRAKLAADLQSSAAENTLNQQFSQEFAKVQESPEFQSATPSGRADIVNDLYTRMFSTRAEDPGKVIPQAAMQSMSSIDSAVSKIDAALAAATAYPQGLGLANHLPDPVRQRMDPQGVAVRAAIANIGSLVLHQRSGAAITVSEWPRLAPFIPQATDSPDTVKTKLGQMRDALETDLAQLKYDFGPVNGYRGAPSVDTSQIPAAAIAKLRELGADTTTRAHFDETFGAGAAQAVLGN